MEEGFNLCILILVSFQFFATSGTLNSSSASEGTAVCSVINCGQGTCKASNASFLGFDCECNSGWRKLQIGLFTFPFCVLPNCTAEFQSGGGSPLPPRPLPPTTVVPFLHGPFGFSNFSVCRVVWCGNGTCVADGAAAYPYTCHCHEGFGNLLNLQFLPCFNRCCFGEDCNCAASPHRSASTSIQQRIGSANKLKCSWNWNLPFFVMQVIAVTILTCL